MQHKPGYECPLIQRQCNMCVKQEIAGDKRHSGIFCGQAKGGVRDVKVKRLKACPIGKDKT